MKNQLFKWIIITLLTAQAFAGTSRFDNPRIGIVISKNSFEHHWGVTQMAAHGWAAAVNLAGIPYDCLFIEDVAAGNDLGKYDLLIFGQCGYVSKALYPKLLSGLKAFLGNGGSLIIDGQLAVSDENGRERDHHELDDLLGIEYRGFNGNDNYRIRVSDNTHFATRQFESDQFVTQHLANGLSTLAFREGGTVLLNHTNEQSSYPFLSVKESGKNRIALISDFSTWSGAASFFRNVHPQVFYRNQLFNVLVKLIHWGIYGALETPYPVPQLSNAAVTAIIRHDADGSNNLDAQIKTFNYFYEVAKTSGVVVVYAWVSSGATKAGWQDLAPLGKKLEELGGEIGTHSKFHRINAEMTPARWAEELDGSIEEIEWHMSDYGYPIGKVAWFINPGNTIKMSDYGEVARRFSFYMTHGFEQDMPLGWGNLTWYTGSNKNFVVMENIPSPDYQWFYDPEWSYTTQQITAYEEAIFDHLFENIGRGALFNEMWHDYSITTQPQRDKDRIINKSNIALYDAISAKFATREIYAPTPEDLGHKMRAMAQWDYRWTSTPGQVEIRLDLSKVLLDTIPAFTGGMGLKIEQCPGYIRSVTINGEAHAAFTKDMVILPNLKKGENMILVNYGMEPGMTTRLEYVSKRMPAIRQIADGLAVTLLTKNKARFRFFVNKPFVLLNADWQEWNRNYDRMLTGYVTSDRNITLRKLQMPDFRITRCTLPIVAAEESSDAITLQFQQPNAGGGSIEFRSERPPKQTVFNGSVAAVQKTGNAWRIDLPAFQEKGELLIGF